MGAWHATYANLLRTRFGALVAYAKLLEDDPAAARTLAENATVAVFSARRSPRGTSEAEVACREWMAAHADDPERAATALIAINALDAAGVRRVLRKATPDPLPQISAESVAELRGRFVASASVYAVPTGGVNALLRPAMAGHRSATLRAVGGTAAAAVALGAAVYFGLPYVPLGDATASAATPSASPSTTTLTVTWNPGPAHDEALEGFHFPECGEEFAPEPVAVGGATPKPAAEVTSEPDYGDMVMLSPAFVTDTEAATWLLANPSSFVVTLDDVVVFTSAPEEGLELFLANAPASQGGIGFTRGNMCDAQEAAKEFEDEIGALDFETATEEEMAENEAAWNEFYKSWDTFEKGVYKVYEVTPIVFGEQAALGQVLHEDAGEQLGLLTMDPGYSELRNDPRISPFCTGNYDVGDLKCDVPADVLKEVLTREVDAATVNDTASGVGISEPIVYDWN